MRGETREVATAKAQGSKRPSSLCWRFLTLHFLVQVKNNRRAGQNSGPNQNDHSDRKPNSALFESFEPRCGQAVLQIPSLHGRTLRCRLRTRRCVHLRNGFHARHKAVTPARYCLDETRFLRRIPQSQPQLVYRRVYVRVVVDVRGPSATAAPATLPSSPLRPTARSAPPAPETLCPCSFTRAPSLNSSSLCKSK